MECSCCLLFDIVIVVIVVIGGACCSTVCYVVRTLNFFSLVPSRSRHRALRGPAAFIDSLSFVSAGSFAVSFASSNLVCAG